MADASEGRAPADAVAAADAAARDAQAAERAAEAAERAADPVFAAEQEHLSATYAKLLELGRAAARAMAELAADAAADKESMAEELATNYATWDDAMETHADFMALNRIIDGYNLSHGVQAERLAAVETLLRQPYFAKVSLRFRAGDAPKDLYLGTAGISDESYRRMVVDWRSPVAEVYYNQDLGPTSYEADGRTIKVDLLLRRQFDIEADRLNGYFDSDVAIQDSLLLASLARQRSAQMQAITATIQKEQNVVIRHEDVPALLVTGIAGSGKTSVLLQRIAYLFYRNRDTLRPEDVCSAATYPASCPTWASATPTPSPGTSSWRRCCPRGAAWATARPPWTTWRASTRPWRGWSSSRATFCPWRAGASCSWAPTRRGRRARSSAPRLPARTA